MICCLPACHSKALPTLPICEMHFVAVGTMFMNERTLLGPRWREAEERIKQERHNELLDCEIERGRFATAHREALAAASVVYYVRTGRYIKIGFTSDLKRRLSELRLHEAAVLATESGGRALEAQRHTEFADERIDPRREDFALSLRIEEHIRELQEDAVA